ncbi:uncharacterized protein LOC142180115 [Nicotiana tabacum]|uniref:Uncharacterized protein LOC142180115 n=1 Tax=Nicotiana tabacum TaxID=4097 RepID=A0AC58UCC5_TOBAC
MYFPDEEVLFAGADNAESYPGWRMVFDGAANFKGVGIGAVLISESGQHYPASAKIRFTCTNNMVEYEACILGIRMVVDMNIKELLVIGDSDLLIHQVLGEWLTKNVKILPYLHCMNDLCRKFTKIEFKYVPGIQNEFADALATLSSMIQHSDKNYIDPIEVEIRDQHAYCFHVDEEPNGCGIVVDDSELLTIFSHEVTAEASSIVNDDRLRYSESADDVATDEITGAEQTLRRGTLFKQQTKPQCYEGQQIH